MPASTTSSGTPNSTAQFREIHKNTWLKRLSAEGRKITIGPKKSERSWVVFCVHDDTEALLEGYAEPRQAPCHNPEWIVPLQNTLHISHALIPNSHEFEFVVTLPHEVVRFHAMSWEVMQEWVETLRSKLREMKILSPRENLYTKLPEIRAPLLPTRDPTSPLPAPPPVPAALVPGVEVVPHAQETASSASVDDSNVDSIENMPETSTNNSASTILTTTASSTVIASTVTTTTTTTTTSVQSTRSKLASMSNTLTQNLLNMLSDPMSAYSEQLNDESTASSRILTPTVEEYFDDSASDDSGQNLTTTAHLHNHFKSIALHIDEVSIDNSVRVDISAASSSISVEKPANTEDKLQSEQLIARPHTSRSLSAGAADKSSRIQSSKDTVQLQNSRQNVTELEISTSAPTNPVTSLTDAKTNVTIIQVSTNAHSMPELPPKLPLKTITAEIFKFPESTNRSIMHVKPSNVQFIPSTANSSTIQVLSNNSVTPASVVSNQYSTPVKKTANHTNPSEVATVSNATSTNSDCLKMTTTVHVVPNCDTNSSVYGTCYGTEPISSATIVASAIGSSTPKTPKKIILSANTSGVTNITVNNVPNAVSSGPSMETTISVKHDDLGALLPSESGINIHYEKVFLSSSLPVVSTTVAGTTVIPNASTTNTTPPLSPIVVVSKDSTRHPTAMSTNTSILTASANQNLHDPLSSSSRSLSHITAAETKSTEQKSTISIQSSYQHKRNISNPSPLTTRRNIPMGSPALPRRRIASPINVQIAPRIDNSLQSQMPRMPQLTRGLTEAVITSRPSRRDFHYLNKLTPGKVKPLGSSSHNNRNAMVSNNNEEIAGSSNIGTQQPGLIHHMALSRANSESLEQRRRSSSTSDAQAQRGTRSGNATNTNNNDLPGSVRPVGGINSALRIQHPPQPFRSVENGVGSSGGMPSPVAKATSPAAKRITLREQQVLQLRREIMHPGGVRLQLRRKDCVGSIAWVDAFGAVWVAGWKQKEHPVLYNALHIGDQLLSIAGITISSPAEANKVIRNTNTLFIEVLVRRLPFGRGYAIRREREGQCLGLIRDGNTATIVDVVPNSLAARHGLPPKAQSCDGSTLTFWVLTEVNGRPLNLFFKDNEIRDRLNSVGRDISILVQPSDLVVKLKKQLKSLRSYKDYLVQ